MLRSPLSTWLAGTAWVEIAKNALLRSDGRARPAKMQGYMAVSA